MQYVCRERSYFRGCKKAAIAAVGSNALCSRFDVSRTAHERGVVCEHHLAGWCSRVGWRLLSGHRRARSDSRQAVQ
eukprot:4492586-Prymnesium_polylepis.2